MIINKCYCVVNAETNSAILEKTIFMNELMENLQNLAKELGFDSAMFHGGYGKYGFKFAGFKIGRDRFFKHKGNLLALMAEEIQFPDAWKEVNSDALRRDDRLFSPRLADKKIGALICKKLGLKDIKDINKAYSLKPFFAEIYPKNKNNGIFVNCVGHFFIHNEQAFFRVDAGCHCDFSDDEDREEIAPMGNDVLEVSQAEYDLRRTHNLHVPLDNENPEHMKLLNILLQKSDYQNFVVKTLLKELALNGESNEE